MKGGLMHGKENLGETFVKDWDTNEPLTVYHATDEEFRQFDNSHLGKNAEPEDYNVAKLGHWFAEARGSLNKRKKIIEAYLNIRNPKTFYNLDSLRDEIDEAGGRKRFLSQLISDGYDGIQIDYDYEYGHKRTFVALTPSQIHIIPPSSHGEGGEK